jgi:hypothetical protein
MLEPSPFNPGDFVVYTPSARGIGLSANDPERLTPGQTYRVAEIQKGSYVLVEGNKSAGGGLYWTEFTAVKATA